MGNIKNLLEKLMDLSFFNKMFLKVVHKPMLLRHWLTFLIFLIIITHFEVRYRNLSPTIFATTKKFVHIQKLENFIFFHPRLYLNLHLLP